MSPFEAMYGYKVHVPSIVLDAAMTNQQAIDDLAHMKALLQQCKDHMVKAYVEYYIKWRGLLDDESSWQPFAIVDQHSFLLS